MTDNVSPMRRVKVLERTLSQEELEARDAALRAEGRDAGTKATQEALTAAHSAELDRVRTEAHQAATTRILEATAHADELATHKIRAAAHKTATIAGAIGLGLGILTTLGLVATVGRQQNELAAEAMTGGFALGGAQAKQDALDQELDQTIRPDARK